MVSSARATATTINQNLAYYQQFAEKVEKTRRAIRVTLDSSHALCTHHVRRLASDCLRRVLCHSGCHGVGAAQDELLPQRFAPLVLPQVSHNPHWIFLDRSSAVWADLPDAGEPVRAHVSGCGAGARHSRHRNGLPIVAHAGG